MDEPRQTPPFSADQIADQHASSPSPPLPQDWPESGDLHATLPLSPQEARGGTSRAIRLPGGRHLRVVVPAGASEGQIISLEGLGVNYKIPCRSFLTIICHKQTAFQAGKRTEYDT